MSAPGERIVLLLSTLRRLVGRSISFHQPPAVLNAVEALTFHCSDQRVIPQIYSPRWPTVSAALSVCCASTWLKVHTDTHHAHNFFTASGEISRQKISLRKQYLKKSDRDVSPGRFTKTFS